MSESVELLDIDGNAPLVSIIIPVYKVEKYIRRCLDSVSHQTYQNIEVLLVDDGSPDKCGEICDEYAEQYSYIKVLHQKNQGQAAARNNAAKISTGEFITFIDSDDFVTEDYVEYLVNLQNEFCADIAIGGCKYIYDGSAVVQPTDQGVTKLLTPSEALSDMNYSRGFGATAWVKLIRRELVLKYPFPCGCLYEDLATMYKIIGDAEKIVFGSKRIYYWVQREGSTMRMKFDERQMYGLVAAKEQLKYIQENYPEVVPAAKARYMGKILEIMSTAINTEDGKDVYSRLKSEMKYYNDVMQDEKVKKSQKIRLWAMKQGYPVAKNIMLMHEKMKKAKFS